MTPETLRKYADLLLTYPDNAVWSDYYAVLDSAPHRDMAELCEAELRRRGLDPTKGPETIRKWIERMERA